MIFTRLYLLIQPLVLIHVCIPSHSEDGSGFCIHKFPSLDQWVFTNSHCCTGTKHLRLRVEKLLVRF